jgi:predicted nucleic acid-binding Zn ribbon protein
MKDPPMKKCEKCGGKLEKQLSASGFVLKGGGWYKDLYASSKPSGGDSESAVVSPTPATTDAAASSKSESKPEPKAEKKPAPATKKKSSKGK